MKVVVLHFGSGGTAYGHTDVCSVSGIVLHFRGGYLGDLVWGDLCQLVSSRRQQAGHSGVQTESANSDGALARAMMRM